jgi:hypothetical protein
MTPEIGIHFDSIESAHDFVTLLSEAVADTRREIEADVQREGNGTSPRRLEALRLAYYKLEKLELHTTRSARILNDLRSLRRLLFEERKMEAANLHSKPPRPAVAPLPPSRSTQTGHPGAAP